MKRTYIKFKTMEYPDLPPHGATIGIVTVCVYFMIRGLKADILIPRYSNTKVIMRIRLYQRVYTAKYTSSPASGNSVRGEVELSASAS